MSVKSTSSGVKT